LTASPDDDKQITTPPTMSDDTSAVSGYYIIISFRWLATPDWLLGLLWLFLAGSSAGARKI